MQRNLSQGDTGPDVRNLQIILNLQRASVREPRIGEDGVFGPETDTRVRAFQDLCDLTVDGVVGPDTGAMLLPERTITTQCVLEFDNGGGFASSFAPRFVRAGVGDPPPAPNPTPVVPGRFAQFQLFAGGQQAFNPSLFSPLVVTAQHNLIIRNPGAPDFTLTDGVQFSLNSGGKKGPGGVYTGQGFGQMGFAFNKKLLGFDLLNPFVTTMISRNQGQPFTWGIGIGDQINYGLGSSNRLNLFFNAQAVWDVDLSNGRAQAAGAQLLGGISFTFGQIPPDLP
jgi:peptidoglycan hydrolase-like protein with peptidoglycan-binding domain